MIAANRFALFCLCLTHPVWAPLPGAAAQGLPPDFHESVVLGGLVTPTAVRFAPDGHVYVAEKSGLVKVFDDVDDDTPTVFADLREEVYDWWDRGLLGLAIHPDYPAMPYVYVLYTYDAYGIEGGCGGPGCPALGRLSRLEADIDAGPVMLGDEVVLIEDWCQQFPSHSIGDLAFAPDGALFVSGGDGASFDRVDQGQMGGNPCQDPPDEGGALRSQDLRRSGDPTSLDGALLRVDAWTGAALPDNPLYGGAVADDDRIVAYGLRNPFRFTLRPGTSEVWIGDVGWTRREEIDVVRDPLDGIVENFGWPCYEGLPRQSAYDAAEIPICEELYAEGEGAVAAPLLDYLHGGAPASISGIAFYSAENFPRRYRGALFYADYAAAWIRVMLPGEDGEPDPERVETFQPGVRPVDLQLGPDGHLYVVHLAFNEVRRIHYFRPNQPPIVQARADVDHGAPPLTVRFDSAGSRDTDTRANLTYAWDLDGDGELDDSDEPAPVVTYTSPGGRAVKLRVTDAGGLSAEAQVPVAVGNTPPRPAITFPDASRRWRVGGVVPFRGLAEDDESDDLPPSALSWEVVMVQCGADGQDCVERPVATFDGTSGGEFTVIDTPYPSHLELRLAATDGGLAGWWDARWLRRRPIRIDNRASGEDLHDVPLAVLLDGERIEYARVAADAADLRFVSIEGETLAHEVESWNPGGLSLVWVRLPLLAAGSNGIALWMYHDNPQAQDPGAGAGGAVWDADFAGVWHLAEGLSDSTVHGNDGADGGTRDVPGALGRARSFDGIDDWIDCGSGPSLAIDGDLSIEAWMLAQPGATQSASSLLSKKAAPDSARGFDLSVLPLDDELRTSGAGAAAARGDARLGWGYWHHVVVRHRAGRATIFVDGRDVTAEDAIAPAVPGPDPLRLGSGSAGGTWFSGVLDEVRVSRGARSDDWIRVQYLTTSDRLLSFGAPQSPGRLSAATNLVLQPETTTLTLRSFPGGLELEAGGVVGTSPFEAPAIVDGSLIVSAPLLQIRATGWYWFHHWSDGGARTHTVTVGAGSPPLIAYYMTAAPPGLR